MPRHKDSLLDSLVELHPSVEPLDEHQAEIWPEEAAHAPRSAGRPPGARNRATRDLVAVLENMGASPLLALGKVIAAGPEELAKRLHCAPLEAYDRWARACEACAPYCHPKLGQLEVKGDIGGASELHLLAVEQRLTALVDARPVEVEGDINPD